MIKRYDFKLTPVGVIEDPQGEFIKVHDLKLYLNNLRMNIGSHDVEWEDHNFFLEELKRLIK